MISDTTYGMRKFSLDVDGIGGTMRTVPEDFRVIEIDDKGEKVTQKVKYGGGIYLHGLIHRRDMSHQKTIRLLGKYFRVSDDDIHLAGIKDRNAVVTQEFSIFNPRKNKEFQDSILEEGLRITSLGTSSTQIKKGHIWGNWFRIIVRGVEAKEYNYVELLQEKGTYNFFGYQRFGGSRPITAEFGRALFESDFERAVDIYLGGQSAGDDETFRKLWRETRDPELLLREWIRIPQFEKKIIESLVEKPRNYRRALERLPRKLNHFSKMAYLSLLFNEYLSARTGNILRGEREIIWENQRNIEIALPSNKWKSPLNELWTKIFDDHEFTVDLLKEIRHSSRLERLFPHDLELSYTDDVCEVVFSLPTGSYATTIMREIMKTSPSNYL